MDSAVGQCEKKNTLLLDPSSCNGSHGRFSKRQVGPDIGTRTLTYTGARTLLGAKGIATRNKDATRGSWPYY